MSERAMKMMRGKIMLAGLALVQSAAALAQPPAYREEPFGSGGETGTDLACPRGSYVVGFAGASGTNIDRIQAICATLGRDGWAGPPSASTAMRGGSGGGPGRDECSVAGTVVTGLFILLTYDGRQVESLGATCAGPGLPKGSFGFGSRFRPEGSFFETSKPSASKECPFGMALVGISIRYGKHVNAVGQICDDIVTTQAAPPPPVAAPPPPARTGRVVTMGRVADDPTNLFNGTWNAKDSQGEPFVITISAKVDGYVIAKVAYAGDPQNADSHRFVLGNGRMLPSANPPSLPWIKGSVSPPGDSRATFIMIKNGKRGSAVVSLLSQGQLIAGGGKLEDGEEYGFQATRGAPATPD